MLALVVVVVVVDVAGVVLAVVLATEQSCGLYDWQVEPPSANAALGSISIMPTISATIRFI